MLDRTIAPEFRSIDNIKLIQSEKRYLSNQTPLFLIKDDNHPLIRMEWVIRTGKREQTLPGQAYFTVKMLQEGTSNYSSSEIAETISGYGAFFEASAGYDRTVFTLYTLDRFLPNLLPLVHEIIHQPTFDEGELSKLQQITEQNIRLNLEKTSHLAGKAFRKALFGVDCYYATSLELSDIEHITIPKLQAYHKTLLNSSSECFIVGNVSEEAIKQIDSLFGTSSLTLNTVASPTITLPNNNSEIIKVEKADSLQATVKLGTTVMSRASDEFMPFIILNEIFGGYFGSRLMSNIREDKGYTYGIRSSYVAHENQAFLAVSTDVKSENSYDTLREIEKEAKILQTELVSEDELHTVKNYMLGSFCGSVGNVFDQMDKFKLIHYSHLDYTFFDKYIDAIKSISAQQIRHSAEKNLNYNKMVKVIAG